MYHFKKQLIQALALITLVISTFSFAMPSQKKVLLVVTSYGEQQGKVSPGYEFDEFSKAYLVFKQHDIAIDVASPKGGNVEADQYDPTKPFNAAVLNDKKAMAKLSDTLKVKSLSASHYDGIFIVGGKGAMFDLPKNQALQQLIADVYQQQGSVAAVCHGPAALVNVKLDNGQYLVANKAVNGFTNQEEHLFSSKWINDFEFLLEDKLVERGGLFQSSEIMLSHVTVDGRLMTGQNPSSTIAVATELVRSLGIAPQQIKQDKEDKTMTVIAEILAGNKQAIAKLNSEQSQYQLPLVGMYGFYYLKIATTNQQRENALTLMKLGQEAINKPSLDMKIANTQVELDKHEAAISTLKQLLTKKPDFKPALDLLKTLSL
ncbi:type 1 glutamine amidotransferase domain-containing protein [Shewanella electrodiphila]|uniref:Type 1 glutamine amidotransferase domain-containing protein n=1 Tax=Shewanella electrodiphila TaxID=934143 RepID=A0ABT0KKF0_9GAMM|nr:type 1 glutamine amidotransferase domain-containing protein [Shewanella electrodiphila]MCL1044298.1 type 1 glutamine amidotransferase domain-containing protein [Shewanella electrodiphila]